MPNPKHPLLLRDLKRDTMITYGYTAYVSIIESLQMDHQKCVFHKMMNQRTSVWKTMAQLERQLKSKENKLERTLKKIQELEKLSKRQKRGRIPLKDKKRRKKQRQTKYEKTRKTRIKKRNKRNK